MSMPTAEDIAYATARVAKMGRPLRTLMARFRDGMYVNGCAMLTLEREGLVAQVGEDWWALPGVIDAFNARFGPPAQGVGCEVRQTQGTRNAKAKAALFAEIPRAFRLTPLGAGAGYQAPPDHEGPERVAVPSARLPCFRQRERAPVDVEPPKPAAPAYKAPAWQGAQVIPGDNPIGAALAKLRR